MLDLNILYLMDCMDGMAQFPDNYFDLAIVDPPYGIGEDWKKDRQNVMRRHKSTYKNDKIPDGTYFKQLTRVSKNQIIWGGNYYTEFLRPTNHWIVWDKKVDYPTQYHSEGELAWHSFNIPLRIYEGIWNGACKVENVKKQHPHQKPVKLYQWILHNYAKPNMKIIDTHVGSASSIIAFLDYGCEWIGFEIDPDYHKSGSERIEIHKQQLKLF